MRRRRAALGLVAVGAAVVGAIAGSDGDGDGEAARTMAEGAPTCPERVAASPSRLAGQRLVVRLDGPPPGSLLKRARLGTIAGVILFPPEGTKPREVAQWISSLDREAVRGGGPVPLALIDQEGGDVKRLPGLPPDLPPPRLDDEAAALEAGERTGAALAARGLDVDLAPVVDIPASAESFIVARAFPGDAERSTALARAFARGLAAGGVAATAKHFPGLGRATVNTDEAPSVVAVGRGRLERELEAFGALVADGVELVMVSNATYPALDGDRPASLSEAVIEDTLREELGFEGVVITDDLGAGALRGAGIDERRAAVRSARAGADLLLFALSDGREAHRALTRALRRGSLSTDAALASCARVAALRSGLEADDEA